MGALDRRIVLQIIEGLWLGWAIFWFVNAFGNKRTVERKWVWARGLLFFGAVVAVRYVSGEGRANHSIFRVTFFSQLAGVGLCAMGLAFTVWARIILGTNWSGAVTLKENHELVRGGPYRFVRHPIYTGIILAVVGTVVTVNPRVSGVFFLVLFAAALKMKSVAEEEVMMRHFQEQYVEYKREVKGLIPYVW